jgi:hypothetical protein
MDQQLSPEHHLLAQRLLPPLEHRLQLQMGTPFRYLITQHPIHGQELPQHRAALQSTALD